MNKKGFTLVELIATIAILSIIALIATPGILKSYNKSKEQAMTIQKTKLVEAGDILLDDYCNESVNKEYKEKCKIYYQELDKDSASQLSEDKNYKYICVKDIKDLKYYTEELKYGGTPCQGVVVYELDKKSSLQTDAFSYVECSDVYPLEKTEKDIKMKELFKNCFDDIDTDKEYDENKTYNITIKFVENEPHGSSIKNNKIIKLKKEDYEKDVIFEIEATKYIKYGSTYEAVLNTGGKKVELLDNNPPKDENGTKIFKITDLPKENLTLSVVYTSVQHNIVTNYYRYYPTSSKEHNNEKMSSKTQTTVTGFNFETKEIDIPDTLEENINETNEKFNLYAIYVDGEKQPSTTNKNIDVGDQDKIVDVIYQREEFNITYNNNNGSGCTTERTKYNQPYGELCKPTRTGYTFKGWSLTLNGETLNEGENDIDNITKINDNYKDITLYAKWEAHKFTLTFNGNNETTGDIPNIICTYDQNCILPTNSYSKTGYSFAGWYLNATSSGEKYNENQNIKNYTSENKTIDFHAGWQANTYKVTFDSNGGGTPSQKTKNVTYSRNYGELPTVTKTGHRFDGWYTSSTGGTKIESDTIVSITSNQTLYAHWTVQTYTLTFNANGGGTPNPKTKTITYGEKYGDLATISRSGYRFDGWYTSATGGTKIETTTTVSTTSNQILYAHWTTLNYTITYNLNGGTNPSGALKNYTIETEDYTLPTPTKTGYTFTGWTGSNGSTAQTTVKIAKGSTGNKEYTANWKENPVAQAIYTDSNKTLTFVKMAKQSVGGTFNGAKITSIYTGFETDVYTVQEFISDTRPWADIKEKVEKVVVKDSIKPKSIAHWFNSFKNCVYFDVGKIDTSLVTDMKGVFNHSSTSNQTATKYTITGLENWNTSNVTTMEDMFADTGRWVTTVNITGMNNWNTSKVTNMNAMFYSIGIKPAFQGGASTVNIGDISNWDVSNVTDMSYMFGDFAKCVTTWNIGDISKWNVSKVKNFEAMFMQAANEAKSITIGDLGKWTTTSATNMGMMFYGFGLEASYKFNLYNWNTTKVTTHDDFIVPAQSTKITVPKGF